MIESVYREYEHLLGSENINAAADPPVLKPPNEDLLRETVLLAGEEKHKIRIIGGGTLPAPPEDSRLIPVSLAGFSAVREVNPSDFIMVSGAGVIIDHAVEEARRMNLYLPLDTTSGSLGTIGGAFMAGSIAPLSAGYGYFRDAVIGVRCVTAEGKTVRFGGRTVKNVTGYDITWFLWGTMGLYAIATELTIKVQPLPETRIAAVARYRPGSQSLRKVLARLSQVKHIKSLEFIAPHGLQGEITISPGIEGLEALAGKSVRDCEAAMESPDLIEYREDSPDMFFRHVRREISKELVGPGFYTVSVPPSASVALIERLSALMPDAPVVAHPLMGRFHVVCSDAASVSALEKVSLALGGKHPAEWGTPVVRGIAGLFTDGELAIARSLKRELDPCGILNPHLKLL